MKKIKYSLLFSGLLFCGSIFGQVAITEIHYDTAYNEDAFDKIRIDRNSVAFLHKPVVSHLGEFIELYNYTTEDIDISGWFLTDNFGKFEFPKGTILKSEQFLVVAYGGEVYDPYTTYLLPDLFAKNYFADLFPTVKGKDKQIIYQNSLLLNNQKDQVKLFATKIRDIKFGKAYQLGEHKWENINTKNLKSLPTSNRMGRIDYTKYTSKSVTGYNFYTPSFQLQKGNVYTSVNATPLTASYVPETKNLFDIPELVKALQDNTANTDWSMYVNEILNQVCSLFIPKVEQLPKGIFDRGQLCFIHDASGNLIGTEICDDSQNKLLISKKASQEIKKELTLEEIKHYIKLYPNPTSGMFTVAFEEEVLGKITKLELFNPNGSLVETVLVKAEDYSTDFNITNYPTGVFILKFTLTDNQTFSLNVLKK